MKQKSHFSLRKHAQAMIEIAIFGAIVLFLIGGMLSQGASAAFTKNYQLMALNYAMELSSLRQAPISFLAMEDRQVPSVSQMNKKDRQPYIASMSASFSGNLFMPIGWEYLTMPPEGLYAVPSGLSIGSAGLTPDPPPSPPGLSWYKPVVGKVSATSSNTSNTPVGGRLPHMVLSINGQTFVFSTAIKKTMSCKGTIFYEAVTDISPDFGCACAFSPGGTWGWLCKTYDVVKKYMDDNDGAQPMFDIDHDGKEEQLHEITKGGVCKYLDFNDGAFDSAAEATGAHNIPGLQPTMNIYSVTEEGVFQINENGYTSAGQSRVTLSGRQYDVIERIFVFTYKDKPGPEAIQGVFVSGDCHGSNILRTCREGRVLYIRSRIDRSLARN